MPQQIAGGGIESFHLVGVALHEQDAIVLQRRRRVRARRQRPTPGQAQVLDVGPVDLFERAVALVVPGAPPREPFAGGWFGENGMCDRGDAIEEYAERRLMRECDARSETSTRCRAA